MLPAQRAGRLLHDQEVLLLEPAHDVGGQRRFIRNGRAELRIVVPAHEVELAWPGRSSSSELCRPMKLCVMNCDGGHVSRRIRTCASRNSTCMCDMNRCQSSDALGLLMAQSPVRSSGMGISCPVGEPLAPEVRAPGAVQLGQVAVLFLQPASESWPGTCRSGSRRCRIRCRFASRRSTDGWRSARQVRGRSPSESRR